ncbi:hypothetical protein D3C75_1209420 [compost metagenome]
MEHFISRSQHFALVDIVGSQSLQNLGLHKMSDTGLSHNRNGNGLYNALKYCRVSHTGNAACCADIGGYTLQRHNSGSSCRFSDLCLLGVHNVHDYAALLHFGHTSFNSGSSCFHR